VKSVLREIQRRKSLHLDIVVTGSHLIPEYENSIDEIINDGFLNSGFFFPFSLVSQLIAPL
jgi:hypothetical protein